MIGWINNMGEMIDLIKRMSNSGHSIGNHSYSHKSLKKQKPEDYLHDINNTNQLIKDINEEKYPTYAVFYPVGNGMRNIDLAIEDIKDIIKK